MATISIPTDGLVNVFQNIVTYVKKHWFASIVTVLALLYCSYVGYSYINKVSVDPNTPVLSLSKSVYNIGELVYIEVSHQNTMHDLKHDVSWRVYDGVNEKTDWKNNCGHDAIVFGSGSADKTYVVICSVSYIIDGEIKNYLLTASVKVGTAPNPPNPPVPNPVDAFTLSVQKAFSLETDVNKKQQVTNLAAVYRQSSLIINNTSLTKFSDIVKTTNTAINSMIGPNSLLLVRRAIADELNQTLGQTDLTLDANLRATVQIQFTRVLKALETIQ